MNFLIVGLKRTKVEPCGWKRTSSRREKNQCSHTRRQPSLLSPAGERHISRVLWYKDVKGFKTKPAGPGVKSTRTNQCTVCSIRVTVFGSAMPYGDEISTRIWYSRMRLVLRPIHKKQWRELESWKKRHCLSSEDQDSHLLSELQWIETHLYIYACLLVDG